MKYDYITENRRSAGYTVAEFAIIAGIIGLLIGGVLVGIQVIENAKLGSTVSQINDYTRATKIFVDSYNYLPGDFPAASTSFPNCPAAGAFACGDGNGDTVIRQTSACMVGPLGQVNCTFGFDERAAFWGHLSAADLISGINGTALQWGQAFPAANVEGGFVTMIVPNGGIVGDTRAGDSDARIGHYFVLRQDPTIEVDIDGTGTILTPHQALAIDRKLDNGLPNTGDVRAMGSSDTSTQQACSRGGLPTANYNGQSDGANCALAIHFYD